MFVFFRALKPRFGLGGDCFFFDPATELGVKANAELGVRANAELAVRANAELRVRAKERTNERTNERKIL